MLYRLITLAAAVVIPCISPAADLAVCEDPWQNNAPIRYDARKEVLVFKGGKLTKRTKKSHERDYRSDQAPLNECNPHYGHGDDRPGKCSCYKERHANQEIANRLAEEERAKRESERRAIMGNPNPAPAINISDASRREISERAEAIRILTEDIRSLEAQNRLAEADIKRQALVALIYAPRPSGATQPQGAAPAAAPPVLPSQPPSTANGVPAATAPPATQLRTIVALAANGNFRLTGGPPNNNCSAFVADVDVRPRIEQRLRDAAPRVQQVQEGGGAPSISVSHFSWECFPNYDITARITLNASPGSSGGGGSVSGDRTVRWPGAWECSNIPCAAQKFRGYLNPLVEELAAELAGKLAEQLPATAVPVSTPVLPSAGVVASGGGMTSAGAVTGRSGGGAAESRGDHVGSSIVGRVQSSAYWCNSLGGEGGGDGNRDCVVPVPSNPNACGEMERIAGLDQQVAAYNGANNELARLHAANRAGRCDVSVPRSRILDNLVAYRWGAFRNVDISLGAAGERACDPQFTGWRDGSCEQRSYVLYFIHACAVQRCVFENR